MYNIIKLLGISHSGENEESENSRLHRFNIEEYDMIVFEEIFFNDSEILEKLYNFKLQNTSKFYMANGDSCQLEIQEKLTIAKKTEYIKKMFPHEVLLKKIKRCENGNEKYYEIKKYMEENKDRNDSEVLQEIIKKYFSDRLSDTIKTVYGLSYLNEIKNKVNDFIHEKQMKKLNKNNKYYEGLKLICKDYYKSGNNTFYRNFEYTIIKNEGNIITVTGGYENDEYDIPMSEIERHFTFPYTKTIHSCQGVTIKNKYMIYDCFTNYMSIKAFWVAISRAKNFDDIYIHTGYALESEKYINVDNYKRQDRLKGFKWEEKDYITKEWIENELILCNYQCSICNENLYCPSVDRISNDIPHLKNNCKMACSYCNKSKSNHYERKIKKIDEF